MCYPPFHASISLILTPSLLNISSTLVILYNRNKAANNFAALLTNSNKSLVQNSKHFSYKVLLLNFIYLKIIVVFGAKGGTRTRTELPTGS